jgi:uncharacterized damage-inducible protein DinB
MLTGVFHHTRLHRRTYGADMNGHEESQTQPERTDPDLQGSEISTLTQFLDYHRATLRMKCAGLGADDLKRRSVPPSTLSLLGLVRHLTEVERNWFGRMLDGQPHAPIYYSDTDPDGDFDTLDSAPVEQVWRAHQAAVTESRRIAATFGDPADLARGSTGRPRTLRWVLVHLIEEYARHNGHADLLREAIDGSVGE